MIKKYIGYNVPIILYDGKTKLSQNITKSDILMGINSEKVKINNIQYIENNMFKIIPRFGKSFILGMDHRLVSEDETNIYLFNVLDYYIFKSSKYYLIKSNTDFVYQSIKIDPYFLGIWLGSKNKENIKFEISKSNSCIIDYINSMINKLNLSVEILEETEEKIIIDINDTLLNEYFMINNLFETRHIPDKFKYNKSVYRLRLLAGILDSNSRYHTRRSYYEIIDEKELIHDINYVAQSLGFQTNLFLREMNTWSVEIYGDNLGDIPMMTINNIIFFQSVCCDFKIAQLFDKRCVEIEIENQNILTEDFILI